MFRASGGLEVGRMMERAGVLARDNGFGATFFGVFEVFFTND